MELISSTESFDHFYKLFYEKIYNVTIFYLINRKVTYLGMIFFVFFVYYYREIVKKPDLHCNEGNLKTFLYKNLHLLQERYWPTIWCFGTHGQTALANMIRGTLPKIDYKRQIIVMEDSGEVSLDWYESVRLKTDKYSNNENSRPIAIFIPGLTGHSQTEYIKSLIPTAFQIGYRVVAFNNRGRGGMKLKTPRLYTASNCEDLAKVLNFLKKEFPLAKIVVTGVSLGGIILGRYLSEQGEKADLDAAMLISVCYDFFSGCKSLENNRLNLALNKHLAKVLSDVVKSQREVFEKNQKINLDKVFSSTTLRDFDQYFTTKMWNYETVEDYYKDASIKDRIHLIKKPTLCLNAADDMFAPFNSLPIKQFEQSSHAALIITQKGGHIGFMEGFLPTLPFYIERLNKQYLTALFENDFNL